MCFRLIGKQLLSTLTRFSADLVGIIAGYAIAGLPRADAKAKLLFSVCQAAAKSGAGELHHALAVNPLDGSLWVSANGVVRVFSVERKEVSKFSTKHGVDCRDIAFGYNNSLPKHEQQLTAFLLLSNNSVCVHSITGELLSSFSCAAPTWRLGHDPRVARRSEVQSICVHVSSSSLFIADYYCDRVLQYSFSGLLLRDHGGTIDKHALLRGPYSIKFDSQGMLFIAQCGSSVDNVLVRSAPCFLSASAYSSRLLSGV